MIQLPKVKIFTFHYKPGSKNIGDQSYVHIWSGKNESKEVNQLVGDNTGDHISSKNKYFSELTGIYWAWKNQAADIFGTCHYRRFFTLHQEPLSYRLKRMGFYLVGIGHKRHGLIYTSNFDFWKSKVIGKEEVTQLMQEYDAILPAKRILKYSVEEHYQRYHNADDLIILREILKNQSPEYLESFDRMLQQKRLYANNMYILKNKTFDELNKWLFKILFEFESKVSLGDYKGYQERIFGFLSERLITCWFMHQPLKIKELNLIYFKKLKKVSMNG